MHFHWPLLSTAPIIKAMLFAMCMPRVLAFCSHSQGTKAAAWTCARGVCALKSSSYTCHQQAWLGIASCTDFLIVSILRAGVYYVVTIIKARDCQSTLWLVCTTVANLSCVSSLCPSPLVALSCHSAILYLNLFNCPKIQNWSQLSLFCCTALFASRRERKH